MRRLLLNTLFPERCFCCRQLASSPWCSECKADVDLILPPYCDICGTPGEDQVCRQCKNQEAAFDSARSACTYEGSLRLLVHSFKYDGYRRLEEPLGAYMQPLVQRASLSGVDFVVPMPSAPLRWWRRGFNPAALLAARAAQPVGLPLLQGVIRRKWGGRRQVGLDFESRQRNVKGRFYIKDGTPLTGKSILLIDDIYTTGATCREAARVLKEAGALSVHVLTLARA